VRITHLPSGIVVQCQNDRSQHQEPRPGDEAAEAKLYELEVQKRNAAQQILEDSKSDVGWAARSVRTCWTSRASRTCGPTSRSANTQAVLDGWLDRFIEASLKRAFDEAGRRAKRPDEG